MRALPSHGPNCVGCGTENPGSLGMTFFAEDRRVHVALRFDVRHEGAPGIAHGGMVAVAFDDTFGALLYLLKRPGVTAHLGVDFRRPAFLETDYTLVVWCPEVDGRKLHMRGEMRDPDGELVAEADALFLQVPGEHFAQGAGDAEGHVTGRWREGNLDLPR